MKRKTASGILLVLILIGVFTLEFNIQSARAPPTIHDICILEVAPSETVVVQGDVLSINVTVENEGNFTETFNVTAYYNFTVIGATTIINLAAGNQTTVTFNWNTTGVAKGNHTISAKAGPVPNETDVVDNEMVDGTVQIVSLIIVPDDYLTIQEAIDAASPGDIIHVYNGTYYENVDVYKQLNIYGSGAEVTMVEASDPSDSVFYVNASNVNLSGFTVKKAGVGFAGVYLSSSNYSRIENINATNNYHGVLLSSSSNNTVFGNTITNNTVGVWLKSSSNNNTVSGNTITNNTNYGVYLDSSSNNNVSGNTITNNTDHGVYLQSSSNNTVSGNTITNNTDYGVLLYSSSNNTVSGNTITNNTIHGVLLFQSSVNNTVSGNIIANNTVVGVYLHQSYNNTVSGNTITNNTNKGVQLYLSSNNTVSGNTITNNTDIGVFLSTSSNNTVSGNTVTNSTWGVRLELSSNNTVSGNYITNNGQGVHLYESSDNKFYHNNFIDNTLHVSITKHVNSTTPGYANFWDNDYPSGGNFWSNYTGVDIYSGPYQNETGEDGIGDVPYTIDANNTDRYPLCARSTRYPWPMFHHNLRNTGYTESPAPNTNQTQWTYPTGDAVWSSPAVANGMVFVGSNDDNVYALDQYSGEHIWNYTTGHDVVSSPAVTDGIVYVGCLDSNVYALNEATGELIWNYTTGNSIYSSPAVADGTVFIGSRDGKVYALNASTGTLIWNYTTLDAVDSSAAVANGTVFIGSGDHNVYALNASTGELIWNYTTGDRVWRSSPAVVDGVVFVGSEDFNVYALNASTGALIWNNSTGSWVWSSPAVADGKVYVGSRDSKVYCLNASTGAFIWSNTTGDWVYSSPAVADNKVYVGSYDDKVYCLDASTGAYIWNYTTGGNVQSSPAVADGMVFVGSYDGAVYAFGNIIRVPEDYQTIQEAIDAATPGTTITISPRRGRGRAGTYRERLQIKKKKEITLLGKKGSAPIFDGGGEATAINITDSSNIIITNIVITNWTQGILVSDTNDVRIISTVMSLINYGITIEGDNATNTLIHKNVFQDNGIAIDLTDSTTSNIICANTITESNVGIVMSNSAGNIIYHNNFINNTDYQVYTTNAGENIWDNGYPSGGNYWSDYEDKYPSAEEIDGSGIWNTSYEIDGNNIDEYPLTKPFSGIGITNITTSKTVIGQGSTLSIDLDILNYGVDNEDSTVTVYADTIHVATQTIALTSRTFSNITFTWNTAGVPYGNYTLTASITAVSGEIDTTDNTRTCWIVVTVIGDVNGDGQCNILDVKLVKLAYSGWITDPNTDIDDNGAVNILDVKLVKLAYSGLI